MYVYVYICIYIMGRNKQIILYIKKIYTLLLFYLFSCYSQYGHVCKLADHIVK